MATLCSVRVLCRLCNLADDQPKLHVTTEDICKEFALLGYKKERIKAAVENLLGNGVLSLSEGAYGKYVPEEAYLIVNESSRLYLNDLILEPSYLQYICEDVCMEKQFIVPIDEKYKVMRVSGALTLQSSRKDRLEAVVRFVEFITKEENAEKEFITARKRNYQNYLAKYSLRIDGKGVTISDCMREKTLNKVRWLQGKSVTN